MITAIHTHPTAPPIGTLLTVYEWTEYGLFPIARITGRVTG